MPQIRRPSASAAALAVLLCAASAAAHAPARPTGGPITLTPARLPRAIHGLDYSAGISASGGLAPYTFALGGGALPAGIALDAAGTLAGVPSAPGASAFTVVATDADGFTGSASFVLPVSRGFRAADDQVELAVPSAGSGGSGDPLLDLTSSTLQVSGILPDAVAVIEAEVYVTLLHERTGDLRLSLVAPDGTRASLAELRGGAGADYLGTCFRAGAADAICDGAAPFAGAYRPEEPAPLLRPNGTWTLEIEDTLAGASGELLDWSLSLGSVGAGQSYHRKFGWHTGHGLTPTNLTQSATETFLSSEEGTVRCYSTQFGFALWERTLTGVPARGLHVERHVHDPVLVLAGGDGLAYALDAADGTTVWSRNLRRPTCSADGVGVAPLVQLWERSGCAFRAATSDDLLYFGTAYECSTTTANRVYALHATDGTIRWTFNATGSTPVNRVTGMVGDTAHDRIFVTTAQSGTQHSVWALSSVTGAKLWSRAAGDIAVAPVLDDGLFVLARSGELAKLDPDTGAELWTFTLAGGTSTFENGLVLDANDRMLFAVDSAGDLHAVTDLGASAALAWTWAPTETLAHVAALPHRPWVVVTSTAGRFHQVDELTGTPYLFGQVFPPVGAPYAGTSPRIQLDDAVGGARVECRLWIWSPGGLTRAFTPWEPGDADTFTGDFAAHPRAHIPLEGGTDPAELAAGELVTDELLVPNVLLHTFEHGVHDAEGVTITTTLPPGTDLVGVEAPGTHSLDGRDLTLRLGDLQLGQSAAVTVTLRPRRHGVLSRTYTVAADRPDPSPSARAVTLENVVHRFRRAR